MIRLENVHKYFNRNKANEIHVINGTSLELPEQGIVTLLGPSGCGKTTLLNAVGGLDRISSGKIFIDDECITGRSSGKVDKIRNAKIGYIFQNFNLLDKMTVFENVALALRMLGIKDKHLIQQRVDYCLEAVGIYQFRNRTTDALSGGQRQRVAIARAIVKNPRIIIADEPTGNLDSANTLEVMNIIKTISKERLVLLVTHEREIAEFYSDRIIEMKDGQVISDRTNDSDHYLDYQLENKIYLKDMPEHATIKIASRKEEGAKARIDLYADTLSEADIKVVIRGGNLYIQTGGRYNVIDENTNIELVDDHYSAMDSSIYEDNSFRYDAYLPEEHHAKHASLYSPLSMITSGLRTIRGFKFLKKLLLLGFVFSAMFTFLAVSNIRGILDVKDSAFLTTNRHYITVANPSKDPALIEQAAGVTGARYVIPGDTQVRLTLPFDDYYQSANGSASISGSLTYAGTITEADLAAGRMPQNAHELVIDQQILKSLVKAKVGRSIGITRMQQFLDRKVKIQHLDDYTIVGIAKTNSPSIFALDGECMNILVNAPQGDTSEEISQLSVATAALAGDQSSGSDADDSGSRIVSYDLRPASFKIEKGREPQNDYEVVVSNNHKDEFELNKQISRTLDDRKLTVVGYYSTDTPADDEYYVPANTIRLHYIYKHKVFSVYADDTKATCQALTDAGMSAKVNYTRDKASYTQKNKSTVRSSLIVAGIIILIALIEMFLMLRSSFLSRIKEVGTMRAIGLKKRDVYRMFLGEILLITVFTAIPGIAIMYYILSNVTRITTSLANMYMVTPTTAVLSFILILIFNLVAGLLPVFRTLMKTPASILSRTDI